MTSDDLYGRLHESAAFVRERAGGREPTVGLVLGSGLSPFADHFDDRVVIPYGDIPHFPVSRVAGHAGNLVIGTKNGATCVAMQGRVHFYEGHSMQTVTFPARALVALGARTVIITNAAGGISHGAGTLMLIRDHINLFGDNPLCGENDERLGPRFPDMTYAYAPRLRDIARGVAADAGIELPEGVYAGVRGPTYETPAEVEMLRRLGGDAVGMSTVPETIAVNHMGGEVLGISCITNAAAGVGNETLSHDDVTKTAREVQATFLTLLGGVLEKLA